MEALRTRRAVRDFSDQPVDDAVLGGLIDAASLAPSALSLQPWAFCVVEKAARLNELASAAKNFARTRVAPDSPLAAQLADPDFDIFHGAQAMIVICATHNDAQSSEDCCVAAATLILAAHAQGLGACWVRLARAWLNLASTKIELGIPAQWVPVAPIVLGYPHILLTPPPPSRRPPRIIYCK
ncbi:nitroreductase family protein [Roseiterribacter gracilis]